MNWLDIVLLGAIGFSAYRGYSNGFIRELVSIASVILAIPLAGIFYDDLFPKVEPIVRNKDFAALVSFLAILIGVIIGGQVAAHMLKRTAEILNLGVLDRLAGAAFGFFKAVVVAQVLLIALVTYPRPDLREDIDGSQVAQRLLDSAPTVLAFLPSTFDEGIDLFEEHIKTLDDAIGTETPARKQATYNHFAAIVAAQPPQRYPDDRESRNDRSGSRAACESLQEVGPARSRCLRVGDEGRLR
ncbi:MAG: CvpA family protein [Dehalococcoidia bacterium]|nr:CvpA family protein [Dehalococcoidia bacterium]